MYVEVLYIVIITALASGLGILAGFGTSTIMVPAMLIFLPLPETLLFVGIIHWFGNIWKIILFREGIKWRLILTFGIPGAFASFLGATFSLSISKQILLRALGAILVIYVILLYLKPSYILPETTTTAVVGGVSYGFLAGIIGVGGEVRSTFLSAFNLHKACYIATAGAVAVAIDAARIATYIAEGVTLEQTILSGLLIYIAASLIGSALGRKIVEKVPQDRFRQMVAGFILLAGLRLAIIP